MAGKRDTPLSCLSGEIDAFQLALGVRHLFPTLRYLFPGIFGLFKRCMH